jgi:hypothetical protein
LKWKELSYCWSLIKSAQPVPPRSLGCGTVHMETPSILGRAECLLSASPRRAQFTGCHGAWYSINEAQRQTQEDKRRAQTGRAAVSLPRASLDEGPSPGPHSPAQACGTHHPHTTLPLPVATRGPQWLTVGDAEQVCEMVPIWVLL